MYKQYFFNLSLTFILALQIACAQNVQFLKEGVLDQHRYFSSISDSANLPMPDNLRSRIWFQDSCIINEIMSYNTFTEQADTGIVNKSGWELSRYVYMDLRTMKCQDYYEFSDSSQPVCNYVVKKNEGLGWNFFDDFDSISKKGSWEKLADTMISLKNFKREKLVYFLGTYRYEYIYYLDCSAPKHIFHLNKYLDEKYPHCKTVTRQFKGEIQDSLKLMFELNVVNNKLSPIESKIFKQWAKNARKTTLPLLDYQGSMKNCLRPYSFPGSNK